MDTWKVTECSEYFARMLHVELPPMTKQEITDTITFLRGNGYPKPSDCPEAECPKYRPACTIGICNVAVGLCGDF